VKLLTRDIRAEAPVKNTKTASPAMPQTFNKSLDYNINIPRWRLEAAPFSAASFTVP
jgi:hypothetical protein